jgi:hypothetical protein
VARRACCITNDGASNHLKLSQPQSPPQRQAAMLCLPAPIYHRKAPSIMSDSDIPFQPQIPVSDTEVIFGVVAS